MEALSPIPNPLPNDDEDVSWALSTAGALWGRGERAEALKWLRRAAEQASDVNDDVRALVLFKAAAEVAQAAASTPPPPSASMAPPASSAAPVAMSPSSFPPPATPQPSTPPPRRPPPPSLPPRAAPPAVPSSRTPPTTPPARTAPAPVPTPAPPPARPVPSSTFSPVTKPSRSQSPSPEAQISPAARSMPSNALAAASAPAGRASPAPRASAPVRGAAPAATVPTRPVASRPAAVTSTPPPAAVTERPPPSRSGRAFEEVLALQTASGGLSFDDLDENTQVLQAVRRNPAPRAPVVPEIEESFRSVLADVPDEVTDPALNTRALDDGPPDDQTGPISAPERTAVTKWTEAERAALMAAPDLGIPERTIRRFAPLLSHRVAVVASSTSGELRVVLLDADAAPPAGAAVVLLVPLTAVDGDVVTQLIGSLE